MTKNTTKDVIVMGFALFSMFFGAGNLLFPPYLGMVSGSEWITSLLGFVVADVGLALLVIAAVSKCNGELDNVLNRAGNGLAKLIGVAAVLCIGPFLAIPRTAATTYEMGVMPLMGDLGTTGSIVFCVLFFLLTLILTIKPSKVVDILGKFLTPALLIALIILIIKGFMTPIGDLSQTQMIDNNLFSEGITQGYMTMDALGAGVLSAVIITSIGARGYTNPEDKMKLMLKAGLIAGVALTVIYGGLVYLGATLSNLPGFDAKTAQASLMVIITEKLLGYPGKLILGVIVGLACLTTSIGLTSAAGEYFQSITKGKLSYEKVVISICVFSAIVGSFGVDMIIKYSVPMLELVYPVLVLLSVMSIFGEKIKNNNAFRGGAYATLLTSVMSVANGLFGIAPFMTKLPLAEFGFNWIIPAIVGVLVGSLIRTKEEQGKFTQSM
ncbi:MAG: branched-chain amino acid transport system II carrier protein [Peptostreptococcaceae bacterium]